MNCWEGVMFTAYQAGLVDEAWLVKVHQRAMMSGQANKAQGNYDHILMAALGYNQAVALDPDENNGPQPQPGDILFFNMNEHVALCVGRDARGPLIMQLWGILDQKGITTGQHGFHIAPLTHYLGRYKVEFAPCPFIRKSPSGASASSGPLSDPLDPRALEQDPEHQFALAAERSGRLKSLPREKVKRDYEWYCQEKLKGYVKADAEGIELDSFLEGELKHSILAGRWDWQKIHPEAIGFLKAKYDVPKQVILEIMEDSQLPFAQAQRQQKEGTYNA